MAIDDADVSDDALETVEIEAEMAEPERDLEARLRETMPMYGEAKRIMIRMMCAGDDGSWAGETNAVRVHIYQIATLAEELQKLQFAEQAMDHLEKLRAKEPK